MCEDLNKVANSIANLVAERIAGLQREILDADAAAEFLGVKKSHLYKMTMARRVPFYKPAGKLMYFRKSELEQWLLSNRVSTDEELNEQAQTYCMKKGV